MKKLLFLLLCVSLMFSCGDVEESINKLFNTSDRSTETEELPSSGKENQKIANTDPIKYEVISKKAYFFSPEKLRKVEGVYLIKGDISLCGEIIRVINGRNYDEFCFCWFNHHADRITTGYLMNSDLILDGQSNSSKWNSLTKFYLAREKTYFFRPKLFDRNRSYLIEGDIAICDNDVIKIQGREYCYCEFKKPDGSNIGRVTTGYLEKEKLRKW